MAKHTTKSAGVVPDQHLPKHFYTGEGSHVAHEAEDETDGFKHGGHAMKRKHHRKHGGSLADKDYNLADGEKPGKMKREARKHGGHVTHHVHHEKPEHLKHAKHVGKVHGHHGMHHAGKKPRKSGGHVFSSAHAGSPRKPSEHY
jgi:hypothetical protein